MTHITWLQENRVYEISICHVIIALEKNKDRIYIYSDAVISHLIRHTHTLWMRVSFLHRVEVYFLNIVRYNAKDLDFSQTSFIDLLSVEPMARLDWVDGVNRDKRGIRCMASLWAHAQNMRANMLTLLLSLYICVAASHPEKERGGESYQRHLRWIARETLIRERNADISTHANR